MKMEQILKQSTAVMIATLAMVFATTVAAEAKGRERAVSVRCSHFSMQENFSVKMVERYLKRNLYKGDKFRVHIPEIGEVRCKGV
jgi:hypothetical protein